MTDQYSGLNNHLLLRPAEAGEVMALSRTVIYELIRDGELAVLRVRGRSMRIPMASIRDYIERNTQVVHHDNQ